MEGLRLDDVKRALQTRDPLLVDTIISLANQDDVMFRWNAPELDESIYTIRHLRDAVKNWQIKWMSPSEAWEVRKEAWARLAETDHPIAHPDRFKLNEIIETLHAEPGAFARDALLEVIRRVPLKWGTWRAIKALYKQSEASSDIELFGAITARIDREMASTYYDGEVSRRTLMYVSRRAWRWLRSLGETFPAAYCDAAVAVLREYPDNSYFWARTWVANHIIYHNTKLPSGRQAYGPASFRFWTLPDDLVGGRAFGSVWKEDPRPLFELLERARSEVARKFAIQGLKADFRAALREVDVATILRLCAVPSGTVHDFVIWLLENSPTFEQGAFRKLGLHDAVVGLLDSWGDTARKYAIKYVRTHARDLPISLLLRHANHSGKDVRKLAVELLEQHDPRKDVGLAGWGQLLGTDYGHDYATSMIHEHFGAGELTLEWFQSLFARDEDDVMDFAEELFGEVHDVNKVDPTYFMALLEDDIASAFAIDSLDAQEPFRLTPDQVRRLVVHPESADTAIEWIDAGKVAAKDLGADFWRAVAFEPSWRSFPWAIELTTSGPDWARPPQAPYRDVDAARALLGDVRSFTAAEVGFDWLMTLVRSNNDEARAWASDYLFEAFAPAEFASATDDEANAGGGNADLGGKSFLFTGKLATMTRSEAQAKVTAANGKNAGSVTKTLDVLVIGDEGSPLYGQGKKGSKQVSADKLIAAGAPISIISETAFLQMLSGGHRDFSESDTIGGYEVLWAMGCGPEVAADAPDAVFARRYMQRHHEVLGPAITDMTVDAARKIPDAFLTFERVLPLLTDARTPVRKFALEIAYHEMARWRPSLDACRALCETPARGARGDLSALVSAALLADDTKETQRLRIPPEAMDREGVYAFCESLDRATRAIGMALIQKYPQFAEPNALFNLTDSPDRRVRAFVIEAIWRLYRDRHATSTWSPRPLSTEYPETAKVRYEQGAGLLAAPEALPATHDAMRDFLRRILFGVPPARFPLGEEAGDADPRLLPAGRAKLYLLEVMRDIALQERDFATLIEPLLVEFAQSLSDRERGACLVALARIEDRWEVDHV